MFKTTVKYTDFLGEEREEVLRFNLSEVEMKDLMDEDPVFSPKFLTAIADDKDSETMLRIIRKLILHAYGELSEDGRVFRKSDQIKSDFAHSAAYTALLEQLFNAKDDRYISDFLIGIFPAKIGAALRSEGAATIPALQSAT